jgi:type IV pilus assembly protein PilY1
MKNSIKRILAALIALCVAMQPAQAALLTLASQPIYLGAAIPPQVMITMTKDQQLFKKAYNDYSDLDSDGVLDLTYKQSITYYGYFDSFKCYNYNTGNLRFEPFGTTADKYCTGGNAGKWSGNFLNWVTMTRMDAVRKLLYGGLRSTDTATLTVLERAYLPTDAHSFAKYYNGTDVDRLTPFTALTTEQTYTSVTVMSLPDVVAITGITRNNTGNNAAFTATVNTSVAHNLTSGDQVRIYGVTGTNSGQYNGVKTITVVNATRFTYTGTSDGSNNPALTAAGFPGYFARRTFTPTITGFPLSLGDQVTALANANNFMVGTIVNVSGGNYTMELSQDAVGGGTFAAWTLTNHSSTGISFCNTTLGGTGALGTGAIGTPQDKSQTNTNPPLVRVARGNHALWSANERFQCYFREDSTAPGAGAGTNLGDTRTNGNRFSDSGLKSNGYEPQSGVHGLGSINYVVRVQACVTALVGQEKCREYNTNNSFKPVGLLQVYGDPGLIHFGLITGSYTKNISGGVLRKNVGTFQNEVAADGTFLTPAAGGIVNTLNKLRIYGYKYQDTGSTGEGGSYLGAAGDNCGFQLTSITEGNCKSWGNPMSEMYFEALRYFAGTTAPTGAFSTTNDSTLITGLTTATWPAASTTVLSNANYCAPLNVVVFNSSVTTNEDDNQIGSLAAINSGQTAAQLTRTVGDNEPGSGAVTGANQFFYGKTPALLSTDSGFELCTAKAAPAGGLGDVVGICPEGPTLGGTYLMSGLAYHAHINRIRTDITAVPANDTKSLKVTTYGVNLSTNVPTLPIKVSGDVNPRVILQPAYRLFNTAPQGGGALVDLKIVSQTVGATANIGSVYLNWEDSEQGGDYDQDMWGTLNWCMQVNGDTASCPQNLVGGISTTNTISITTRTIAESTGNPQGFGYIVSGTSRDGPHFHSGIEGFNFTDPTTITVTPGTKINASGGCNNCQLTDAPTTAVYTLAVSTAQPLKDPLYLAAKYGGFKDSDDNNLPNLTSEWDQLLADGSSGSDGSPDNYFLVSNPLGLENALNKVFLYILLTSSASSVATNSTSLQAGTKLYQARFNSNDWSGQVLAFAVNSDGSVSTTPDWDAGILMNPSLTPTFDPNARVIITNSKGVVGSAPRGVPFRWPSVPATPTTSEIPLVMVTELNKNPGSGANDSRGSERVSYLRGVATSEGVAAGDFRRRQASKLGDIVNSNPNFVGAPNAGHGDAAYATFRLNNINRTPIVYAASNDGMLHGFNATNDPATRGKEVLAFMPSKAALKANKLTSQTYQHEYFVDGSPEVQDVCTTAHAANQVCTGWATYLAGTLGAGGHGVFMLDVTTPSSFAEGSASSIVKWEFTDADDADLGNSPGTPLIRRMANGKWAVIVSGGYNNSAADGAASTTGRGVIFILFTSGPTGTNGAWTPGVDYIKIDTLAGSVGTPNGLAQPFSADINTDGIIDFLYAGDLLGNLWKFDVRSTTAANWTSATNRVVLFQARDASSNVQPITAQAEGTSHVTGTGFMINFGTGKYLENTDVSPPGAAYLTQTYYGIWDKNDGATVSVQTTATRAELMQQQVLASVSTTAGTARVVSDNQPNWTNAGSPPLHKGWYLDFPSNSPPTITPSTGERAVFAPAVINGRLIFTTLVPSTASCSSGGQSFLMVLDNMTGGRFVQSPFDTSGDGTINSSDLVTYGGSSVAVSGMATGIGSTGGIAGTPTVIKAGTGAGGTVSTSGQYAGGTTGSVSTMGISSYWEAYLSLSSASVANVLLDLGSNSLGRLSWREITAD